MKSLPELERHELSSKFNDMDEVAFTQLKDSIKNEGLKYPVIVHLNKKTKKLEIVDGWQRYRAIKELLAEGVQIPGLGTFNPGHTNNPVAIVIANHLARRNMTAQERARAVRDINEWREKNDPKSIAPTQREMAEAAGTSLGTMNKVMQENKPKKQKPKEEVVQDEPVVDEPKEETPPPPPTEEKKSRRDKLELLQEENEGLRMQVADLEAEKADLNEQIGIYTNSGDAEQARELDLLEAKQQELLSFRTQVNNLQAENKKLARQRDGYKKQIETLESRLDELEVEQPELVAVLNKVRNKK